MKPSDVKAYMNRDWTLVRDLKESYWAQRKQTLAPEEAFAVAEGLRQHVLALRPDWPDEDAREEDHAAHRRVSECLRSVRPLARA
jgi:hypothetical protein